MRLREHLITRTSLVATALVAGLVGVASVTRTPEEAPASATEAIETNFEETLVITAPADDLLVELAPTREAYLLGEPVAFTARITNLGTKSIVATGGGVHDLAVQRIASSEPMGLGDVAFLALMDVPAAPFTLAPGESVLRSVHVGAGEPFDRPGLHRVSGQCLFGDRTAVVRPFMVRIDGDMPIAAKADSAQRPGA